MREIIDRILEGEFQPETGSLTFSCTTIDIRLAPGADYEGTFEIHGSDSRLTEGYLYTDSLEMECLTHRFAGSVAEIAYRFCGHNTCEGDIRQGEFVIVSNHGEYAIPYKVTIIPEEITSSMGTIKNLFHFANLARTNWDEAVSLFYSSSFRKLFHGVDKQFYPLYRGLSGLHRSPVGTEYRNERNVEEFLLAIKKKQKITYLVSETEIKTEAQNRPAEHAISINRNGWGYTLLQVETEGAFLSVGKDTIREEDFLGNFYRLPYYIAADQLHAGRNFGYIRLYNTDTDITIPVTVLNRGIPKKKKSPAREKKQYILQLMTLYTDFRNKNISASAWRKETAALADTMIAADDSDIAAKLFRAQLLITAERYNEAGWMLDHAAARLRDDANWQPALWCYHQYLTTLISGENEYIDEVSAQLERVFTQYNDDWRIAWLLTYLQEEYRSPARKWQLLEDQFMRGCTSPVIYIEALNLLKQNPALLMKMERFEIHVLTYAVKKDCLHNTPSKEASPKEAFSKETSSKEAFSKEYSTYKDITYKDSLYKDSLHKGLISQIVYLISRCREFSVFYLRILEACYRSVPSDEVIKAICALLIKGNRTGTEYLPWYRLGIDREIRVTRLFEHYMMSVDLEQEENLPKMVLMYFAYRSELDYRYNAYLYAYVHKYRSDFPELYESYREAIERFVIRQMSQGRITRWLAYLYKSFITSDMITEEAAQGLVDALFTVNVRDSSDKAARDVIILYDKGKTEAVYPLTGRQASLPLYSSNFHIFLEDASGNRYIDDGNCTIEKWLRPDKLGRFIAPLVTTKIGFDLWLCEKGHEIAPVAAHNLPAMQRLQDAEYITEDYQKTIRLNLIRHYYEHDMIPQLDQILENITPAQADSDHYTEIIKRMISRSLYPQAYQWLCTVNSKAIDAKLILRALNSILPEEAESDDKIMTTLAHTAFHAGKYDEKLLRYLARFYQGSIRRLRNLWKAAADFGIETYDLSERLLIQMLYSSSFVGEQMQIFRDYVTGGGRSNVEMAFLAQCAHDYFVGDKITDVFIIDQTEKLLNQKEDLHPVCRLAFVKYYAENPREITDKVRPSLKLLLKQLIDQNITLSFYKEYIPLFPFMEPYLDKTIVEYHAKPGNKAVIHYLIERDGIDKSEYVREEMKDMYGGVCAKQFVLFFGDRLLYYIAEEEDEKEHYTESAGLTYSDPGADHHESRYTLINDIEIARNMQDYETVDRLMYELYQLGYVVNRMFRIM